MNAMTIPKPISENVDTVTISRADWDALRHLVEDAADLAAVRANDARRADLGEAAFNRECMTGDEVRQALAGVSAVTIYRKRAGLTQRALASAAGVSGPYLNEVEKGRKPGSLSAMRKIAGALGVSVEALVG